jgi:precorrin-6x reductase
MMKLNKQAFPRQETTRLLIGNIPYAATPEEFARAFGHETQIQSAFLSRPKAPDKKNAGWGIIEVDDEATAVRLLAATVMINNRVARIQRARPKVA